MTDIRDETTFRLLNRLRSWEQCTGPDWLVAGKEKVIAELRAELERRGERLVADQEAGENPR